VLLFFGPIENPRWPPAGDTSVVKAGKPFSDHELICEIKVKNGLDLGENYRNINGCKTFAASIAQTLVDKQVKFKILSSQVKSIFNLYFTYQFII
jgi:hypothetical protein